ncbi:zinc finger CCCH domain-containing protein 6-like [Chenopodium quinoa]|uniref:zinc finger CCCH domain-containing protein 6-like n=1 Tax=Chenopodium quinoa TaxID=63459 RepID=UPI000B76D349|nr:zinc finger CCCH domain-containing protein 6-like [Chenopodium quinoa]
MQGSQKSKRVSWASDGNLCQVRLFLSEESPSQVGAGAQDHLQVKKIVSGLPVNGLVADDNLPPGFEGFNPANQLKNRLAQIPVVKWRSPPKFTLGVEWQVVSGEESKEVEIQSQRELRVLEAYYPRQSAIPLNPASAPDIECAGQDDQTLPSVPITAIEEDLSDPSSDSVASACASATTSSYLLAAQRTSSSQGVSHNINSGTLTAGVATSGQEDALKAALTAVAKGNEQIDHNLLVKILSNPTILEQLVRHQGPGTGLQSVLPKPMEGPHTISRPSPGAPMYRMDTPPPPAQYNNMETGPSSTAMMSNGLMYPYTNGTGPMTHQHSIPPVPGVALQAPPVQSGSSSQVKDLNYYKNLIQQHGGERQADPQPPYSTHPIHHPGVDQDVDNSKPRDAKHKIMKLCMYFNSAKGCKHGTNCVFQHDMSLQQRVSSISEMQSAKRMKMDREIRGPQSYS